MPEANAVLNLRVLDLFYVFLKRKFEPDLSVYFPRLTVKDERLVTPLPHSLQRSRGERTIGAGDNLRLLYSAILADCCVNHNCACNASRARTLRIDRVHPVSEQQGLHR